jgi:hypothetical protein
MQKKIFFSIKLEDINVISNQSFYYFEFDELEFKGIVNSKLPTKYDLKSVNYSIRDGFVYAEGIAEYYSDKLDFNLKD